MMAAQDGDGGFVLASTFVKKTEDQLDAFREQLFLILDHPLSMFGWTSKSKSNMEEFKQDLVAQLAQGTGLPAARIRVLNVDKASRKKAWVAVDREPAFYLGMRQGVDQGRK